MSTPSDKQLSPAEVSSMVADDAAILGRPDEADVKGRLIFFQTALYSPPTFYPSGQLAPSHESCP